MASVDRKKKKDRFAGVPHRVLNSEQYIKLKAPAVKLLLDILWQYNGSNNGELTTSYALLKDRGWSSTSLNRAYRSLVHGGFIVVTRQGLKIKGYATFVAITWKGIDSPRKLEKYDAGIKVSPVPLGFWKTDKSTWSVQPNIKPP